MGALAMCLPGSINQLHVVARTSSAQAPVATYLADGRSDLIPSVGRLARRASCVRGIVYNLWAPGGLLLNLEADHAWTLDARAPSGPMTCLPINPKGLTMDEESLFPRRINCDPVTATPPGLAPARTTLSGTLVRLEQLNAARHAGALYRSGHGSEAALQSWEYRSSMTMRPTISPASARNKPPSPGISR